MSEKLLTAAERLADARLAWAEAFVRYRGISHVKTDALARAMADADHIRELTLAEAEYEVAKQGGDDHALR